MFNNSAGFQIHSSHLYSVAGDVNLQTHQHLTIQDHRAATFHPPVNSTLELMDGQSAESQQRLTTEDHRLQQPVLQPVIATWGLTSRATGSEREWTGYSRWQRHGSASRPAPYNVASRPCRPGISYDVGRHTARISI
ncbi:hypothetical protein MVEN_01186000 [Mycena venus]|uniref:Uncharacterized protein n=1 Tax=Mycena venus TaxID=2733690 RepID=A0A8H7CY44_9AGAR|nr:hypothetical protein MVEN_01186000 [Mycena venus]